MNHMSAVKILSAAIAVGYGPKHVPNHTPKRAFQALGTTSAGVGAASVEIYGSLLDTPNEANDRDWVKIGTINLTLGTVQTTDGFTTDAPWRHMRAKVASISGTNASVDCWMGG